MHTTTVAYGMTESLYRATENYVPMADGWRRLRDGSMPEQTMAHFEVPNTYLLGLTKESVAEAMFIATNAPDVDAAREHGRLAAWLFEAVAGARETGVSMRSLSVGDTVTVWGQASVACQRIGWREIA